MGILTNPTVGTETPQGPYGHAIIFLYSERVDEVARWYIDVLGFQVKKGPAHFNAPGHSYWLDAGPLVIAIHQAEKYCPGPYDQRGNSTLFGIATDDAPADVIARAREHGIEIVFSDEDAGHPVITLRDIEGRPLMINARG
jgi:uncharacterized glyoxalase superfamily protein PhnB